MVKEIRCITNTKGFVCNNYLGDMPMGEGERDFYCRKKGCKKHWRVSQTRDGNLLFKEIKIPEHKEYEKTGIMMEERVD